MRMAAYVGASTVLAAGAVLKAFHERPNFYSASVYLAQSNACRMILLNELLLTAAACVYCLQRLLYGRLRPIETEQLWDKSWYAITETALAMTTFRDEVGGWFFVMFMSLLAGKVWGWIGEGRVEILEQQPPANPMWFHTRLMASLLLSEVLDLLMLRYCVYTLLEQPKPGMMVMFAFEFAILAITSTSTAVRYCLTLQEILIVQRQTKMRIDERRQELQLEQEEARRVAAVEGSIPSTNSPESVEVDESEIDVPGWQEKGRWLLFLDLATDFCKLLVYFGFFTILLVFHSIPIHIIRDVFVTSRSFVKRISDFIKYRNATKDMNARYPDATADDLERDCTCIICREEMRPWQAPNLAPLAVQAVQRAVRAPMDERQRPKKLPCGHILHFGCLRSWLERQQVCPTCRASVLGPAQPRTGPNEAAPGPGQPNHRPDAAQMPPQAQAGNGQPPNPPILRARTFALGPLRLTLAAGEGRPVQDLLRFAARNHQQRAVDPRIVEAMGTTHPPGTNGEGMAISEHLDIVQRRIMREINSLNYAQNQLATVRALQGEFARLRIGQSNAARMPLDQEPTPNPIAAQAAFSTAMAPNLNHNAGMNARTWSAQAPPTSHEPGPIFGNQASHQHVFGAHSQSPVLTAGNPGLPAGLALPDGWTLLPLQRVMASTSGTEGYGQYDEVEPVAILQQSAPEPMPSSAEQHNRAASIANNHSAPTSEASRLASSSFNRSDAASPVTAPTSTPFHNDDRTSIASNADMSDLPNWSNAVDPPSSVTRAFRTESQPNEQSQGESHGSRDASESSGASGSTAQDADTPIDSKGKARAVTVEDLPEDPVD